MKMQDLVEIGWCLVVGPAEPGQGLHDRVHSFHLDYKHPLSSSN